jgi:anthranilate synthase/aminodeoxychorismate synthase-like glutamine amidotransferase
VKKAHLIIDNHDSFTFNIAQAFGALGHQYEVHRNDAISIAAIADLSPRSIVLSPGPGRPEDAGICPDVVQTFGGRIPILGVCLGHQVIASAFGARIEKAQRLMHGKVSRVYHDGRTLYAGLSNPFEATRYHSLAIEEDSLPGDVFEVSAYTTRGEIMGIRHRTLPIEGVQFHPESILTPEGQKLFINFLQTRIGA